ncbi:TetR/AcrR family transcriptional regulator [Acidothermaceae bacterium B102]|nr:TetR/AcrR family transcriptional regulator [Acidothermaceae bacterium B102]
MGRWDPDAGGRLQHSAMTLYLERGYEAVTTAEIAEHAGLKKRTYFRHFADKREVLFAGAEAFQSFVVDAVVHAGTDRAPMDVVITALADSGTLLEPYRDYTRARRDLIASSTDLQERDLIKLASLTAAVAEALREREVEPLQATLTAQAGVAAFSTAYDLWADDDGTSDFGRLVHQTLDNLRRAIGAA